MNKRQLRELIIRVIEDSIILFLMFVGIWALAYFLSHGLDLLGVL